MKKLYVAFVLSAILGAVGALLGLVFGLVFALAIGGPLILTLLLSGVGVGGIVFVAALPLFTRDQFRYGAAVRKVRKTLLSREDIGDAEFVAAFPEIDSALLLQTRQAIAEFFDVPEAKIDPTDKLREELQFKTLELQLFEVVVPRVLAMNEVECEDPPFRTSNLVTIGDLADTVQGLLESYKELSENREAELP